MVDDYTLSLETKVKEQDEIIKNWKEEQKASVKVYKELEKTNKTLETKLKDYEAETEKKQEKINQLKERIKELKEQHEQIKNLEKELENYLNENEKTQEKNKLLISELKKIKEQEQELVTLTNSLTQKYQSLETKFLETNANLNETANLLHLERKKNQLLEEKLFEIEEEKKNNTASENISLPLIQELTDNLSDERIEEELGEIFQQLKPKKIASEPILLTETKRDQVIWELLTKIQKKWTDCLNGKEQNDLPLTVSLLPSKNKNRVYQILNWIKKTITSFDFPWLFEKWSGGKEYNADYDFDGSLLLFKQYLDIDFKNLR